MRKPGAWLGFLVLAFACGGGDTSPTRPSTESAPLPVPQPPSPPTSASTPRAISVGEEVKWTLTGHGTDMLFDLTAPADGTLVVHLSWDATQGRLQLALADRLFANFPDNRSPIIGKLPVVAGGKYRVRVADGAPWDYDELVLPFVLTTSIE